MDGFGEADAEGRGRGSDGTFGGETWTGRGSFDVDSFETVLFGHNGGEGAGGCHDWFSSKSGGRFGIQGRSLWRGRRKESRVGELGYDSTRHRVIGCGMW